MSAATINTLGDSAVTAIADGDYATALSLLRRAQVLLSIKPDSQGAGINLRWDRLAIDKAIAQCERAQASDVGLGSAAGVMQYQKITYISPSAEDC